MLGREQGYGPSTSRTSFPETELTAIDISPIQPSWVPPNLKFEVDDMNLTWLWPENHFDFIHFRVLYGCVPDWIELYSKAFRKLKPGEAGKKTGRSFDIARGDKMKESMEAAGFIDIEEKKIESFDGFAMYLATQVLGWKADEVTVLVAKLRNVVKRTANHYYINANNGHLASGEAQKSTLSAGLVRDVHIAVQE
ncbi:hypothetical protein TgHK011_005147 [Trichoderma gracile]|nr:hypothetical protein TgHK011_005147 [Trichoderma gracile]